MTTSRKVHLLRAKPPWRDWPDHTMCGRLVTGNLNAIAPGAETAREAYARAYRNWRPGSVRESPPDGGCATCWNLLGDRGRAEWARDPVKVLRLDMDDALNSTGRDALRMELRALATLVSQHRDEFRCMLEAEQVLAALA